METDGRKAISKGGEMIHEVGTARMGHNDTDSVVNQYGQSWAVPNLFVMDGAVMVSSPDKNPTLSILALAWRSADHLATIAKQGALCSDDAKPPETAPNPMSRRSTAARRWPGSAWSARPPRSAPASWSMARKIGRPADHPAATAPTPS